MNLSNHVFLLRAIKRINFSRKNKVIVLRILRLIRDVKKELGNPSIGKSSKNQVPLSPI